jgi:protein-S-isoprenylcysteine O-methyltransferase Ste14
MMPFSTLMLVALSVICWVSFALAILWHFDRSAEPSWLMKCVALLGTCFGLLQLAATIWAPATSVVSRLVALVLYGSALTLFGWAVGSTRGYHFALAFTPSDPTVVLAEGPYRWVRHPFYASYLMYWIAGACATQARWMIVSVIVMSWLYWLATVQEETEFLQGDQADVYRAYINRTGRFFPKLWGNAKVATGPEHIAQIATVTRRES